MRLLSLIVVVVLVVPPTPVKAIPVVDMTNYVQNLLTALENVDQTIQAIRSYQTQLAEYEELVKSTAAVPVHTYDRIQSIKNNLKGLMHDLQNYRGFLLDVGEYLKKLGDPDYYRSSRCYGPNLDCPQQVWSSVLAAQKEMEERIALARLRTLDELEKAVVQSETSMTAESEELEDLTKASRKSVGQLQAAQTGNELSAAQVRQMMLLRQTLNAQHKVWLVEQRAKAAREAQGRAASQRYRQPLPEQKSRELHRAAGLDPWEM